MWDLPGPGLEPVSPELAGGFLTTAPPGKPYFIGFVFPNQTFGRGSTVIVLLHVAWTEVTGGIQLVNRLV